MKLESKSDQVFYRSCVHRQHIRSRSFASSCFTVYLTLLLCAMVDITALYRRMLKNRHFRITVSVRLENGREVVKSRLRVVPITLSPSCVTRLVRDTNKLPREILGERNAKVGTTASAPFSSPEDALLLVTTKNRDYWC